MNEFYYHLCAIRLGKGSIIKAGNWGRIIRRYRNLNLTTDQLWKLTREQTFEIVRVKRFPGKPSRLTSIFLCESMEELQAFMESNERYIDVVHKVKVLDKTKQVHRGCMSLVKIPKGEYILPKLEENALNYWSGKFLAEPEILVESDVEVIESITL